MRPRLPVPRREFLRRLGVLGTLISLGGTTGLLGGRALRSHPRLRNWATELGDLLEVEAILEGFLLQEAGGVLEGHRRQARLEGETVTYLVPSQKYPYFWYWDSMLGAVAASYARPELARLVLETQGAIFEMVSRHGPQIIHFVPPTLPLEERIFLSWRGREGVDQLTQTPLAGLALWVYAVKTGDLETARRLLPAFGAHYRWLAEERVIDPQMDLPVTIHPFESLDAQPAVDLMYGRHQGRKELFFLTALRTHRHNRSHGYDARRIAASGGFVMYDPCFLAFYLASLYSLSELWAWSGGAGEVQAWRLRAERGTEQLVAACFDPQGGQFYCRRANRGQELLKVRLASGLMPLLLPLPPGVRERLVETLTDGDHFLGDDLYLPFVARSETAFYQEAVEPLWRGPGNAVLDFTIGLGLHLAGEHELAGQLYHRQHLRAVLAHLSGHPFPEFYTPSRAYRGPYTWGTLAACSPAELAT